MKFVVSNYNCRGSDDRRFTMQYLKDRTDKYVPDAEVTSGTTALL